MKKILFFHLLITLLVAATSCGNEGYSFNPAFATPTELSSPKSMTLDVTSTIPIVLSWTGGGAEDGGIVLYTVLFDKADGDFSHPIATYKSDLGAEPQLTITQADINTIARNAGIKPDETGSIKWTVTASKGGEVKTSGQVAEIAVTRGEGIDNIPSELYLYGPTTENGGKDGLQFRQVSEGVFCIYTKLGSGNVSFRSSTGNDAYTYYINASGKLKEGTETTAIEHGEEVSRITINFNTLSMSVDKINTSVRCIWGATFNNIAILQYAGNGKFTGDGDIRFLNPADPSTNPPSWLSWIEERYYFIAQVNGGDKCWGRGDNISAEWPSGSEAPSFYELHEFSWSQWDHLWKMKGTLDNSHATITIDTNANNLMTHTFTNIISL